MTLTPTRRAVIASGLVALSGVAGASPSSVDVVVTPDGLAAVGDARLRCAIGAGGIRTDKHEGDGATPAGSWPLREVFYRADRLARPNTRLPVRPLRSFDGWCDAPGDPQYNKLVRLPYEASAERLWRKDGLYDLIVVVGYNDAPVVPGAGSAIFLHVARAGYAPTAGCVAFSRKDLLSILKAADASSRLIVRS
jgi:L,D-peptidoglycan transpeptidase YkuD (ErfK/YbiS/YcfS/YnhG family)